MLVSFKDYIVIVFVSKVLNSSKMIDAIIFGGYSNPKPATHETQKIADKVSIVLSCICIVSIILQTLNIRTEHRE